MARRARKKNLNEKVKVIFRATDAPDGKNDIFVAVNGKSYLIKRDEEVEIPRFVLSVIDDAIMTVYEQTERGLSRPRNVKRFPYEVIETEEEDENSGANYTKKE